MCGIFCALFSGFLLCGCAASGLKSARRDFYTGKPESAVAILEKAEPDSRNSVLFLMERGMARQVSGDYKASVDDWNSAVEIGRDLDVYSIGEGSISLLSNDRAMSFRGAPYERTLLHAFAAKSYLAMKLPEDAAVEARNIIQRLENLNGFPDDAYSRYLAGFCLECVNDLEGAALQYRMASELLDGISIEDATGKITRVQTGGNISAKKKTGEIPAAANRNRFELVCFIASGRAPGRSQAQGGKHPAATHPYAEIYSGGKLLGRSYTFSDTYDLMAKTEKRLAAVRIVKDTARIIIKDTAADALSKQNELLGELLRWFLFVLESPDRRHWATLPRWLQVARVSCPPDISGYTLVFRNHDGRITGRRKVEKPLVPQRSVYVSFYREIRPSVLISK